MSNTFPGQSIPESVPVPGMMEGMMSVNQDNTPEPPIAGAYTSLMNSITDLDRSLERLFLKIGPALGEHEPSEVDCSSPNRGTNSELAKCLYHEVDRVNELIRVTNIIANRVEL